MTLLAATVMVLTRQAGRPLAGESRAWLALAVLLAAGVAWRDADLLLAFDVLGMLTALVLLAMSIGAVPVPRLALARVRDLIGAAFGTGFDVASGVVPLVLRDAQFGGARRPQKDGSVTRIARAALIAAPILLVFTLLLTHADPVFGSFFRFPDIKLDVVLSHIVIPGFFAWVVAGWLRHSLFAPPGAATASDSAFPFALGTTDIAVACGALNVLFAAFVVVQIGWLFGGEALVLETTGLTYAAYARRGFFELMWVAGLLLPVLLGAQALIPASDSRTHRLFRQLAVPLVVLLGAILASAGARMRLYVQYYGISTDRLYASAVMIWLAIVFVWLALTVLRARPRTFAAGLIVSGFGVLVTLNVINPDAMVARANLARSDAVRAGAAGTDLPYVATLGGDAVPALVSALTARETAADSASCNTARIVLARWTGERPGKIDGNWMQWNSARSRAVRAVRDHESDLRRLACAKTPAQPPAEPPIR
jgi:hypothetical protein